MSTPSWLDDFPNLKAVYEAWIGRELVPIEEFNAMTETLRGTSFSAVVRMNDTERKMLLDGIGKAISEGLTVSELRASMGTLLENPAYADLVYRVNVGNAFLGGQYAEMFGAVGSSWTHWRYLAVLDSRNDEETECTHLICRALDGKVFKKTNATGWRLLPPNHYQCRCNVEEISETEAASLSVQAGFNLRADAPWDFDKRTLAPVSFQ